MRVLKIFSVFLLVIIFLAGLAIINRCRLGEVALTSALQGAGMRPVGVRINQLGLHGLSMNSLSLSKATPDGDLIIDIKHLSLRYTIASLLGGGIDSLQLEKLTISLPEPGPPKKSAPSLPDISMELAIPPLPPCQLTIDTLILKGKQLGPMDSRPLRVEGEITSSRGLVTITHPSDPYGPTILSGSLDPSGLLSLDLTQKKGEQQPAIHLECILQPQHLSGFFSVDLHRTHTILAPFWAIKKPVELHGMIHGHFEIATDEKKNLLIKVESEAAKTSSEQFSLEDTELRIIGKLREISPGRLLFNADPGLTFKARNIDYGGKKVELVTAHLTADLEITQEQTSISGTGHPLLSINGLHLEGMDIEELNLHPLLEIKQRKGSFQLACWPPFQIDLSGLSTPGFVSKGQMSLVAQNRFEAEVTRDPHFFFKGNEAQWMFTLPELRIHKTVISPQPITITNGPLGFGPKDSSWQAALTTDHLDIVHAETAVPLRDVDLLLSSENNQINLSGNFSPQEVAGLLELELHHDSASRSGMLRCTTPTPLTFSTQAPLSTLAGTLPFPLEITEGRADLQLNMQWPDSAPLNSTIDATLTGINGIYKDITFLGLNLEQSLNFTPEIFTSQPLSLSVDEVQCGIPITDIFLTAQLLPNPQYPLVAIDEIRADLLNGHAFAHKLRYDHGAELNTFDIKVRGLDLASVSSTMNLQESMDMSGKIDGTIPLELTAEGIRVRNGAFSNQDKGGIIRYLAAEQSGLGQSPLTAVVQKALEDFHYDLLEASADFQPSGELRVSIHMEGKSPKLETTRPVHINLNTQQNILSLLKSLRYSKAMTDELNKQIQHHYTE